MKNKIEISAESILKKCQMCGKEFEITKQSMDLYNKLGFDIPSKCNICLHQSIINTPEVFAIKLPKQEKINNGLSIDEMNLSNRAYNCLKRSGIHTLKDLFTALDNGIEIRNLGRNALEEILIISKQFGYDSEKYIERAVKNSDEIEYKSLSGKELFELLTKKRNFDSVQIRTVENNSILKDTLLSTWEKISQVSSSDISQMNTKEANSNRFLIKDIVIELKRIENEINKKLNISKQLSMSYKFDNPSATLTIWFPDYSIDYKTTKEVLRTDIKHFEEVWINPKKYIIDKREANRVYNSYIQDFIMDELSKKYGNEFKWKYKKDEEDD